MPSPDGEQRGGLSRAKLELPRDPAVPAPGPRPEELNPACRGGQRKKSRTGADLTDQLSALFRSKASPRSRVGRGEVSRGGTHSPGGK